MLSGGFIDVPVDGNYEKLQLTNDQGILIWVHERNVIPHSYVSAITEVEVTDKPEEQK